MTISSIGLLTNLEALLKSSADGHSSLSGRDLVARKVRYLAVMGGEYPRVPLGSSARCGCNFCAVHRGGLHHTASPSPSPSPSPDPSPSPNPNPNQARTYSNRKLPPEELKQCLYSIADNNAYLYQAWLGFGFGFG